MADMTTSIRRGGVPASLAKRNSRRDAGRAGTVNPVLVVWMTLILAAVGAVLYVIRHSNSAAGAQEAPGPGTIIEMGVHEMAALDEAWGDRKGFIVWSSTMYGQHDLVRMDWPSGRMTHLTKNPCVDTMPKISPDGKRIAFARSRREWVSLRNVDEWDIWVYVFSNRSERLVAERGMGPSWSADGKAVVFHRGGREIRQVDLESGRETLLLENREPAAWTDPGLDPQGGQLAVTILGKRPQVALLALPAGGKTKVAAGSQPAFWPDGDGLVLVAAGGRMNNRICRTDRNGRRLETLIDMPGYWSHEFFPRVSTDGRLLVFGAAREGHEHDTADYEIFLWPVGEPEECAARVSFHTGNDQWPDVWLKPTR